MKFSKFTIAAFLLLISLTAAHAQTASFVKFDAGGTSSYGADGHNIALGSNSLPSYSTVVIGQDLTWTWAPGYTCWYNSASFTIDVTAVGQHQIALYAIDYDKANRAETIQVKSGSVVLDTRSISGFAAGEYIVWDISGHVTFTITPTSGPNAVVSAMYFDPVPGSGTVTPPATCPAPSVGIYMQPVASASSYQLLRSSVSGGPYTQIATSPTPVFTDATVTAGVYFYVTNVTVAGTTSGNSYEMSVTVP